MLNNPTLYPLFQKGRLFILSGPAGSGKTTLIDRLHREFSWVEKNVSYTTRKKRKGEIEGKDYFFLSQAQFQAKEERGEFLETIFLFQNYYGTSKSWVQKKIDERKVLFLVIDTQGAEKVKQMFSAVSIFLKPPSLEILRERLSQRDTEGEEALEQRLKRALYEIDQANRYDYQLVNQEVDQAYQVLKSIMIAELHRSKQ